MGDPHEDRPPRPGRRLLGRTALGFVLIACLIGAAVSSAVVLEVKDDIGIFDTNSPELTGFAKSGLLDGVNAAGAQTILLIGSDHRYGESQSVAHSDSMLLVRLDPDKASTTVMSIPRDLQVTIPGHGVEKINAAYAIGGPPLTVKMLKALLGTEAHPFPINNVVNVTFDGFKELLNRLGCVYVDIDRHYFNDNNPPAGPPGTTDYATIDVQAGYQKLCGSKGLDYVRYRHFDDDPVRSARQQDFLGQAKQQIGVGRVFDDRKALLKLFAKNTRSTIHGEGPVLSVLKLAAESASHPVQEVQFPNDPFTQGGIDYVRADPAAVREAVRRFMNAEATPGARSTAKTTAQAKRQKKRDEKKAKKQARRTNTAIPAGLVQSPTSGENAAIVLATKPKSRVTFPVYYPTLMTTGGRYIASDHRAYVIRDQNDRKYQAYRIVVNAGEIGQYYGVQGMTWMSPPILEHPSESRRIDGRTYQLFYDGTRLRLVAWRTPKAVYWVSNTLLRTLTNKQMLGIATSTKKIG